LVNLIKEFRNSDEFISKIQVKSGIPLLEDNQYFNNNNLDFNILNQLFKKTAHYWRNIASSPEEIYWSVLTEEHYKGELTTSVKKQFLGTGQAYFNRIKILASKYVHELPLSEQTVLDFGCGVGRLAVHFKSQCKKIHCVDFSSAHLEETRKNLSDSDNGEFELRHINQLKEMGDLPKANLVYSFIVLQHNTPPVISYLIKNLLGCLVPGGLAFLQLPLAGVRYNFNHESYLSSPSAGKNMEMHILPKSNINEVANMSNCKIVESNCIGGSTGYYSEEIVFMRRDRFYEGYLIMGFNDETKSKYGFIDVNEACELFKNRIWLVSHGGVASETLCDVLNIQYPEGNANLSSVSVRAATAHFYSRITQ